jgi:GT2 family glycosyltransferase/SAM-dependent methyltransferase
VVAEQLVRTLAPRSVFDAGCGQGRLVEALWARGIDAAGRDATQEAVASAPAEVRASVSVGGPADPIDGHYDLVVSMGVVERLGPAEAGRALDAMVGAADRVLFAPGLVGGEDHPSRQNVRPDAYWLRQFALRRFAPVLAHDASYVGPHAFLVQRAPGPVPDDLIIGAADLLTARARLRRAVGRATGEPPVTGTSLHEMEQRFTHLVHELTAWQQEAGRLGAEVDALQSTRVMRYSKVARKAYAVARRLRAAEAPPAAAPWAGAATYDRWVAEFDQVTDERCARLDQRLGQLRHRPLVSVLMPVFDTPERYLREAIDSVIAQRYDRWELCVVDDCSSAAWVPKVLEEYAARDGRIRVARREENGHISAASNTGLEMARGEWVVLLDHDDVLTEHALALCVLALEDRPDAGLVYSDEDKLDDSGARSAPFFKPDFDPLHLLAQNYVCHLTMVRRELAVQVGGFRVGMEGSQDWDLVLRATEQLRPDQVVHVPHVLYHWRLHAGSTAAALGAKPYAVAAGRRAVADHLDRMGWDAELIVNEATGVVRVRWPLPDPPPTVSIVVPTRDGTYLEQCLESIFAMTAYPSYEVVVVDNGSVRPETQQVFRRFEPAVKVLRDDRPFNFSALNNLAVAQCHGDVVCLMNDDCEVTDGGWLEEMVSQLSRPGVGIVGAKLLYPDGHIQHAGVVLGIGGVAGHVHLRDDRLSHGYFGSLQTPRSLSAVTAACMVVRREVYEQLDGLDEENLPVAFNDVDFCIRAREAGWRVVWTPYAVLTHHESVSRGYDVVVRPAGFRAEIAYMDRRWGPVLRRDPAYNPNLTLVDTDFTPAFPPRAPWPAP